MPRGDAEGRFERGARSREKRIQRVTRELIQKPEHLPYGTSLGMRGEKLCREPAASARSGEIEFG